MRQHISAVVDPSYMPGVKKITMQVKNSNNRIRRSESKLSSSSPGSELAQFSDGALTSPQLTFQDRPSATSKPLHESNDPAIQAMGLAAAEVSGCCSVGEPNKSRCLESLQTVDKLMTRKRFQEMFPKLIEK